jgi:hypothetical protein
VVPEIPFHLVPRYFPAECALLIVVPPRVFLVGQLAKLPGGILAIHFEHFCDQPRLLAGEHRGFEQNRCGDRVGTMLAKTAVQLRHYRAMHPGFDTVLEQWLAQQRQAETLGVIDQLL